MERTDILKMLPMIFGAVAVILNCMAYCIVKTLTYRRGRPSRLCCAAWSSIFAALLLLASGGCSIWLSMKYRLTTSTWIGFFVVLSGMYWMVQAMKYHKMAKTQSAGYQPFNHNASDDDERRQPQRRRSNAPLIVEVDDPNNLGMSIEQQISSLSSPATSSKSRFSQRLIRQAVPPSPFVCTQGTDSYVAIPMSITKSIVPRSGSTTPQGMSPIATLGQHAEDHEEPMNDTLTEPQAEDSMDDEDEEDGKQEVEDEETPRGTPERKTSEGNDTMC